MTNRRTLVLAGALIGLLGLVNVVWTVLSLAQGDVLTALVTGGLVAFTVGMVAPFARTLPGRVVYRGSFNEHGTTLRPDLVVDLSAVTMLFGGALAGTVLAIFVPLGMVAVPEQARVQLPFVGGVVALVTVPFLLRNLWRGSYSYLYLSPMGFEMAEGWRPCSAQWAEVRDIGSADPKRPKAFHGGIVATLADGSVGGMSASGYTPGGDAVRELVRFYWEHPADRDELTDGGALKRLADRRFA